MCRLHSLVPPANAHPWAWHVSCLGNGKRAELGGDRENTSMLGGFILYAALSKPTSSAWLAGHHKPSKLSPILQDGLIFVLLYLTMSELQLLTGIQEHQNSDLGFNPAV